MTTRRMYVFMILMLALAIVSVVKEVQAGTDEKYKRSVENYVVPDVTLINQNGNKVKLNTLLHSKKPVLVDFIFTTCTTVCPILSAGFSNFQVKLGTESDKVQLISISIDPDHDSPKAMKEYLKRYGAKSGWDFLTGHKSDIDKVLTAFGAYTPDKMAHLPLTLLYSSADNQWIRLYGLFGASDLKIEYEKVFKR